MRSDPRKRCAAQLKILSDQTRLAVMRALMRSPRHVGELGAALNIEQSLLSHHLRALREAGLVETERDGKAVLYRLAARVEGAVKGRALDLGCCRLEFD